ncbi:MAG: DUF1203 domain-containing protein [Novosphingobium sp.]
MSYRIEGLQRSNFSQYYGRSAEELAAMGAVRVVADANDGFPCRVTLQDAHAGDRLILLNFTSHRVAGPFRTAYAIFVREDAPQDIGQAVWVDRLPPVLQGRTLSLRGFDGDGMLHDAALVGPEEVERGIAALFAKAAVAYIHAHYASYGCFAARIDRAGE